MPNINADSLNNPGVNFENRSTDHAAPGSGRAMLYIKNGSVYVRLDTGDPVAVGGVVTLAEGQLAVGDGSGQLSALALGTEGYLVTADASGHATWAAPSGNGAGDLTLIETHVVPAGGEGSYTFASIPGTYSELVLVGSGRGSYNGVAMNPYVYFNTDTQNHYLYVSGGLGALIALGRLPGATSNAGYSGSFQAVFPRYADTTFHKTVLSQFVSAEGAGSLGLQSGTLDGYWASTSAITDIHLTTNNAGVFLEGSAFSLYGRG